jgi:hypothetical protein
MARASFATSFRISQHVAGCGGSALAGGIYVSQIATPPGAGRFRGWNSEDQCSDFRFQISESRFQISDFRFQNSEFRFQISEFRIQNSDFRIQISEFRIQISDFRFQISNMKLHAWLNSEMVSDFNLSLFRIYESECEQVTSFELRLPPGNQISNFNCSEAREVASEI